jgi:hypothetical protein
MDLKNENFSIPFFKATDPVPVVIYNGALPTIVVLDKNGNIRLHHEVLQIIVLRNS